MRISVPENALSNAYTAVLVVKALRKTAPTIVAFGYASDNQACNGGTAAFNRKPISINKDPRLLRPRSSNVRE